MPNINADISVLRLHESIEAGFRAVRVTTVADLVRWLDDAERPRVPGVGATKIEGLRTTVARWWSGDLGDGRNANDPTPDEIEQRCAAIRRDWPERMVNPPPAPVEIHQCREGQL